MRGLTVSRRDCDATVGVDTAGRSRRRHGLVPAARAASSRPEDSDLDALTFARLVAKATRRAWSPPAAQAARSSLTLVEQPPTLLDRSRVLGQYGCTASRPSNLSDENRPRQPTWRLGTGIEHGKR